MTSRSLPGAPSRPQPSLRSNGRGPAPTGDRGAGGGRSGWIPGQKLVRGAVVDVEAAADPDAPVIGVLALQGDVLEHLEALRRSGATPRRVRTTADLDAVDGLIIPGGESTTIGTLLVRLGLLEAVRARIAAGLPVFGTCAGMILLSDELEQDVAQPLLGGIAVRTRRNAFGRQVDSFDTRLEVAGIDGGPVDVSFIRAPWVAEILDPAAVKVLAEVDGHPVVVRQGRLLAAAFHPEVTGDDRLHAAFVASVLAARGAPSL